MAFKRFLAKLNLFAECRKYNLRLWECPDFVFVGMGVLNIVVIIVVYVVTIRYINNQSVVVLFIILASVIILTLSYLFAKSYNKIFETSRLKFEFINIISHQLLTPLSSAEWSAEILLRHPDSFSPDQLSHLAAIKNSSKRMMILINNLLDIGRIEENQIHFNIESVDLFAITKEMISVYSNLYRTKKIDIKPRCVDPCFALGDVARIRSVISNFIDNAIKYSKEEGSVDIFVTKEGDFVKWAIKDKGVGIPKSEQARLFSKFYRTDNLMRRQTTGSGLGLYINKFVIEKLGGKVGFKSEEGKGSEFWFTLPKS